MRCVFDERVRQAARLLAAPESAHRSVTDIAFACGFNDVSLFGRISAGKRHMRLSECRRRAR
jgi:transcriptional regulator GlxA family with amidase domain